MRSGLTAAVAALIACSAPAAADAKAAQSKYVYYEGIVAQVDHKTGDLVLMGNREDLPDEIIVKLRVDPNKVEVYNSAQQDLTFQDVAKEDQIDADCRIEGEKLIVEEIYIYGTKPDADDDGATPERRVVQRF